MKNIILSFCLLFSLNIFAQDTATTKEPLNIIEDMPYFPSCDTLKTFDERKKCTEQELLKFLHQNIRYPTFDKKNGIDGLVVISFVVNTQGKIENVQIIKDRGGQLALEVKRVILMMNDLPEPWQTGTHLRKKANITYTFPIRIKPSIN